MKSVHLLLTICLLVCLPFTSSGIDTKDTKMLSQPAVSADHIAFSYAMDLWVADIDGANVRRLTSVDGMESQVTFSPDGKLVAFTGQYDGNQDVFVVPVEGGVPKRLTWHPGPDIVRGFTLDGSAVLFVSNRNAFARGDYQLYKAPLKGGMPELIKLPRVFRVACSPDGQKLAYNPTGEAFRQWKRYRGGTHSVLWIYTKTDHSVEKIAQPEGRCNDFMPMWIENKIYFLSDRKGEFNLYSFDPASKAITQLTQHADFPILTASSGAGKIIYEQAGYLHLFDPASSQSRRMTIGIATDLMGVRPRYEKGANYVRSADISPSGARAVLGFRGEIVSIPAEKGDPRYLTQTPGVHENSAVWSPDGKKIAYFSDASGEYELHLIDQDGKGKTQTFPIDGHGFYNSPVWSPDSTKISFVDNSWSLYWIDLKTGAVKKIASEHHYGPEGLRSLNSTWSPDSKWVAYTLNTKAYFQRVFLFSTEQDKSYPVTDGLSEVSNPVFDKSGKYLYFFASTDAGPVKHWFAMSSADMEINNSIYLAVLQKGVSSPLAKESDEEKGTEEKKDAGKKPAEKETAKDKTEEEEEKSEGLAVDFDGLELRIVSLPVPSGSYFNLQAGDEGQIYYMEVMPDSPNPFMMTAKLNKFDLKKRQPETLSSGISGYKLSADNNKLLYWGRNLFGIAATAKPFKPGEGKLNVEAVEVQIDPRAEWRQIFYEAWRVNRDYFYDPNMHGADWEAMKTKYAAFLPHLSCRADLNNVIQWMCSELAVGHHRVGGGNTIDDPKRVPGGLLGADFEIVDGRYRFKKVYGGLNWSPELRSPLTEPGVDVREGEYLLAVQGKDLRPPQNLYGLFENTAGKLTEITVGPDPDGKDSRTVQVVPLTNEYALRNRDWVEGNIQRVTEATNGRVAYTYVPNTANLGHVYFKRYFFPQSDRDAIIVDERYNGGGQVADYYIDLLRRPLTCYWNTRYGADLKTPSASIQGPKVMLINEQAGSGGDLLPWMWRKFGLGKLIGKRTWGGLVGTLGFPPLMDGGGVTAPNIAIWTEEGFIVENVGVPPDIEVEEMPADYLVGRDAQLEKAIEVILEELKKNPPRKPVRPKYPKR
jgi:tricorn protease